MVWQGGQPHRSGWHALSNEGRGCRRNTKSEARNPKQIPITKGPKSKTPENPFWSLGFSICLGFGPSALLDKPLVPPSAQQASRATRPPSFPLPLPRYNGFMDLKSLTALPVFNEAAHVTPVLDVVRRYSSDVLVVNDGSTDGTSDLLAARNDIHLITHSRNSGYGAALVSAFDFALRGGYEVLVTIDCDGQHEPALIPHFVRTCMEGSADIVSGSRYLRRFDGASRPPEDRRQINETITRELNDRLGLRLTDAFVVSRLTAQARWRSLTSRRGVTRCRWNSGCRRPSWGSRSSRYPFL